MTCELLHYTLLKVYCVIVILSCWAKQKEAIPNNDKVAYYQCNRSETFWPKGQGKRQPKSQGKIKKQHFSQKTYSLTLTLALEI